MAKLSNWGYPQNEGLYP